VNKLNNFIVNYFKIPKKSQATQNALAGHMWPVGRVFETPGQGRNEGRWPPGQEASLAPHVRT